MKLLSIYLSILVFGTISFSFNVDVSGLWNHYKKTFIKEDGFVVDPYNQYRVTSESQGYTMVVSALLNDRETFYRVWKWTKKNLQREDGLFSWLWINGAVVDRNNATDADLLIAYALLIGYERWGDRKLLSKAGEIIKSIDELIITVCRERPVPLLIPGKEGFIRNNVVNIKVAYYIPFIFKKFYQVFREDKWLNLYKYTYELYTMENLSTDLHYDLYRGVVTKDDLIDADGLRVLVYSYIDDKKAFYTLRRTFYSLYSFYEEHKRMPDKYYYSRKKASDKDMPFCFYYFFGKLYDDKSLVKKFEEGMNYDKENYYCYTLVLLVASHP